MIPSGKPYITNREIEEVKKVLESGWLTYGDVSKKFEEEFAEYIGVKHSISLNSGTSALFLAVKSLGLKGEIIVPSFTYVATVAAILTNDCKPVFCDIRADTCNINPLKIEEKITEKTLAILPVHFAGQSCEIKEMKEIAEKHNLYLIEDAAEAIGAEYSHQKTGTFGTACFSFFPTKNMTTGEGGMVTTNDSNMAELITLYKEQGLRKNLFSRKDEAKPWIRNAIIPGYNLRMSNIAAAIGLVQLEKLDKMNALRIKHADYLNKNLNFEGVELPIPHKSCKHVYQMYTIKLDKGLYDRDKFVLFLRKKGVGASVHFYPPVHQMPIIKEKVNLKVTEDIAKRIVTLPMYPQLKKEELDKIINSIEEGLRDCKIK